MRQHEYARVLASRIPGLDDEGLDDLCRRLGGRPLAELPRPAASRLIGVLEGILRGETDLDAVLDSDAG